MPYVPYLSTQKAPAQQGARVPRAHEDQGRQECAQGPAAARPESAVRLSADGGRAPARYRLGRGFSLGRNKNFRYVFRKGKSTPGRLIALTYLRAGGLKVGFSTSSKLGNAVVRNRVRRVLREDFRMLRPELKPGKYIFVARAAAAKAEHRALEAEMRFLLSRAGLFRANG